MEAWYIYHINVINAYQGRQRGVGGKVSNQKNTFCACILCQK